MTIKFHDFLFQVRIPYKNFKIETARHNDLVLLTVGYFSNRFIMTRKCLYRLLGEVFKEFIRDFSTKILLDLGVLFLLWIKRLFVIFGSLSRKTSIFCELIHFVILLLFTLIFLFFNAVCAEVPQSNFCVVAAGRQLVNIGQVYHAKNDITNEPRRSLRDVFNVLFLFFVKSHRFWAFILIVWLVF